MAVDEAEGWVVVVAVVEAEDVVAAEEVVVSGRARLGSKKYSRAQGHTGKFTRFV